MNKKLQKLLRDPKLFFSDMYLKRSKSISKLTPKKQQGHFEYTVVSAVYNVGRYLDAYFESIIEQRLNFKKNIHLIMVDDGSTDQSAQIIKKWQKKFPANITYIYKVNGGQASARNLGIEHVKTEWVTFIDPDDFLDLNYFLETDNFLKKNEQKNIKMLCCNLVFFHEDKNQFSDSHPLKYRFAKGDVLFPSNNLGKHMQLSASTSFFRTIIIQEAKLCFSPLVRPNFEDGHFIGIYRSVLNDGQIGFAKNPKYFYRKRADGSSTLDTSWQNPMRYDDVLYHGYLDLFKKHVELYGSVSKDTQRIALYDLIWYIKRITNKPECVDFLTPEQKTKFTNLIDELFTFIDTDVITEFELAGCWFYHKVGILGAFKNQEPPFQIAYLEDFDPIKSQVLIRYFSKEKNLEIFSINSQDTLPVFTKTMQHDFLDRTFIYERRIWLPIPVTKNKDQRLSIKIGMNNARISFAGKQHKTGINIEEISPYFLKQQPKHLITDKFSGAWLLMDRDTQADDNAEHLYRYIQIYYPHQPIFFVLRQESHDWERLENEGFKLLAFSSKEHESALRSCKKIISSHIDRYVENYFKDGSLKDKQLVFLQHGVTKDDLSAWLNGKQINCFVTSALPEQKSIAGDFNRYKYTKKETVLTGFPRHDALLAKQKSIPTEAIILIMPTWRKYLLGDVIEGNIRNLNPLFMETEFAQAWSSFLQSPRLKNAAQKHNYKVIFYPHANIQPYLPQFNVPEWMEVLDHTAGSIQELFARAAIMITDYSSVVFELTYLKKPVIHYQFDEKTFFAGAHAYQKGYFNYREVGFGPVVTEEAPLLDELEYLLTHDRKAAPLYQQRIEQFFPHRDGQNCERTYQAIIALDQPHNADLIDLDILQEYAQAASVNKAWPLAENRWRQLIALDQQNIEATLALVESLRQQGKLTEAAELLNIEANEIQANLSQDNWIIETAELKMAHYHWEDAACLWANSTSNQYSLLRHLQCLAELGHAGKTSELVSIMQECVYSNADRQLIQAWQAAAEQNWPRVINCLSSDEIAIPAEWQLLRARAYRELELFDEAHAELAAYEKHSNNDPKCRIEIARLALVRKQWAKVLSQLIGAYPEGISAMPLADALMWVQAQRLSGKNTEAFANLEMLEIRFADTPSIQIEREQLAFISALRCKGKLVAAQDLFKLKVIHATASDWEHEAAKLHIANHNWAAAEHILAMLDITDPTVLQSRLQCFAELGQVDNAAEIAAILSELEGIDIQIALAWLAIAESEWQNVIHVLSDEEQQNIPKEWHLLRARAYRELELLDEAHIELAAYEKHSNNDPACRIEIARLAFTRMQWGKVLKQLAGAYPEGVAAMPLADALIWVQTQRLSGKNTEAFTNLEMLEIRFADTPSIQIEREQLAFIGALRCKGKLTAAQDLFNLKFIYATLPDWEQEAAKLHIANHNWAAAEHILATLDITDPAILQRRLQCFAELGQIDNAAEIAAILSEVEGIDIPIVLAWLAIAESEWQNVIHVLSDEEQQDIPKAWHLLRARAYRELELLDEAHNELAAYEKHSNNDPACRIEIARLAFARMQWGKVLNQLAGAYPEGVVAMPLADALMWVQTQRLTGKNTEAFANLEMLEIRFAGTPSIQIEREQLAFISALRCKGKLIAAQDLFKLKVIYATVPDWGHEAAQLQMAQQNWAAAEQILATLDITDPDILQSHLLCFAELHLADSTSEIVAILSEIEGIDIQIALAWQAIAESAWQNVIDALTDEEQQNTPKEWHLLRARAYRELELFDEAHAELAAYEKHTNNDPACRIEIAQLAFARMQWNKVLNQLAGAFPEGVSAMPLAIAMIWVQAQRLSDALDSAASSLEIIESHFTDDAIVILEKATLASARQDWDDAVTLWERVTLNPDVAVYKLAQAYRKTGAIEKGLAILVDAAVRPPQSTSEWMLRIELATLSEDWEETVHSWKSLLRFHPSDAPAYAWERLQVAQLLKNQNHKIFSKNELMKNH
ncbi:MAG: CDP-glycerol glycerophosphotransferase family protein [Proteobacteria bacterium]|nr:CDP-glycerol glycerophosphotransferase family protein [Pseudomonadota bacterium]